VASTLRVRTPQRHLRQPRGETSLRKPRRNRAAGQGDSQAALLLPHPVRSTPAIRRLTSTTTRYRSSSPPPASGRSEAHIHDRPIDVRIAGRRGQQLGPRPRERAHRLALRGAWREVRVAGRSAPLAHSRLDRGGRAALSGPSSWSRPRDQASNIHRHLPRRDPSHMQLGADRRAGLVLVQPEGWASPRGPTCTKRSAQHDARMYAARTSPPLHRCSTPTATTTPGFMRAPPDTPYISRCNAAWTISSYASKWDPRSSCGASRHPYRPGRVENPSPSVL